MIVEQFAQTILYHIYRQKSILIGILFRQILTIFSNPREEQKRKEKKRKERGIKNIECITRTPPVFVSTFVFVREGCVRLPLKDFDIEKRALREAPLRSRMHKTAPDAKRIEGDDSRMMWSKRGTAGGAHWTHLFQLHIIVIL